MKPFRKAAVLLANSVPPALARRFTNSSRLTRLVRPIANRALPRDRTMVTVRAGRGAGLRLEIDPRAEKYYWSGLFETEVQDLTAQRLVLGGVMWDVGAHIGFLAAIASRAVGPTGRVVAFEPMPQNANRLRHTVAANSLTNVTVLEVAVASSVGVSTFYLHANSTMGGLEFATGAPQIEVQTTTLDTELDPSRPPTLVKIDVEGFQDQVILGGKRLFTEIRPLLIIELLSDEEVARAATLLPHYKLRRIDIMNFIGEPTL
jgi:FkbM family methyltransferase